MPSGGWNKGKKYSVEMRAKMALSHQNISDETRKRMSLAHLGKIGELASNWKGGLTSINVIIRQSQQYALWRKTCMARDNYTCQDCGKRGGRLHVDHEIPLSFLLKKYKITTLKQALACKEIWKLENGRTLCVDCHQKTDTWGSRAYKYMKENIFDIANLK